MHLKRHLVGRSRCREDAPEASRLEVLDPVDREGVAESLAGERATGIRVRPRLIESVFGGWRGCKVLASATSCEGGGSTRGRRFSSQAFMPSAPSSATVPQFRTSQSTAANIRRNIMKGAGPPLNGPRPRPRAWTAGRRGRRMLGKRIWMMIKVCPG